MSRRPTADDHPRGYEPYEQAIRPVVLFTLGLAAATVLVLWLMKVAASELGREAREGSHAIHPLAEAGDVRPKPLLQETPALDLERFRAKEEETLSTYGWVDRSSGVVRIPIERAMEIVAREGLPKR
jgi:hypothetical protein